MKQYWELKDQAGDALLLFRMGDFYELFGDDAVEAARILEITLTSRDKNKPNPVPMAGVPHHSVQGYLQRLLKAGKKVAIGEQMEDPASVSGKSIVRRAVTRIFTPGVQFDLEGTEANYLAVLIATTDARWVLACLDASTGETLVSEALTESALENEMTALPIRHILVFGEKDAAPVPETVRASALIESLPANYSSLPQSIETLRAHYGIEELSAFLPSDAAILAVGTAVTYAARTQQQERLAHLRLPSPLQKPKTLVLGPRTAQHLDLLPSADGTPNLFQLINRTRSALGARQLRRWLTAPLKSPAEIGARQKAVRELGEKDALTRDRLSTILAEVYDLERISGRIHTRLANPRDTLQLGRSLAALRQITGLLNAFETPLLTDLREALANADRELAELGERITRTQSDDAPLSVRDGGIFTRGTSAELDRLLDLGENGQRWLVDLEARERESTGISSLKVRYNRVFGYYLEVTQAHLKSVPSHYQRKQTTVGAERFFTDELKKFEEEILTASSRQKALEQQLFDELLQAILAKTRPIMDAARLLGELDALISLSRLSDLAGWAFPSIDDSLTISIRAGRHPLVDQGGSFVPNDLELSPETRLSLLITGPNMGGKSTVMRQCALIVILGQIGAPVPASAARWGAVSSLYTRIGAHDAIARGQSTFMVEMSELAHILHYADPRSLIILDEIGRGTSTYDGMSVAWSTLEWICRRVKARTLFATHYHELTKLDSKLPALANAHMAVAREDGKSAKSSDLRFLYQLKEGPTHESFGIHVARIAGLPSQVIERAWKILAELESGKADEAPSPQLSLFMAAAEPVEPVNEEAPNEVLEELKSLDLNRLTPIEALNTLAKLQDKSRESASASCEAPIPQPLRASSPRSSSPTPQPAAPQL